MIFHYTRFGAGNKEENIISSYSGEPPVAIRDENGLSSGAEARSVTKVPMNILHFVLLCGIPARRRE